MGAARKNVNVTRVIDGDTVEVTTRAGLFRRKSRERIRLYGIDAPESSQKGGGQSTRHLRKIIGRNGKVWLESSGTDQYGRTIGLIYRGRDGAANSYNYQMVAAGHAHCYMLNRMDQERYKKAEQEARSKKRGLWKQKNPTYPWEYRKAEKARHRRMPWRLRLAFLLIVLIGLAGWCAYQERTGPPQAPPAARGLPGVQKPAGPLELHGPPGNGLLPGPKPGQKQGMNMPHRAGKRGAWRKAGPRLTQKR
jgi:endonuclease YncB( thermonuclease family)